MNRSKVQELINEYTQELKELRIKLVNNFNQTFHPHMVMLMNGQFESVTWNQYTPYFNDGDVCTFGVHIYDAFVPVGKSGDDPVSSGELYKDDEEQAEAIESFLYGISEILELVFGDHVQVTVTQSGVEVSDYDDHD